MTRTRTGRIVATASILVASLSLVACSGSEESNLDVLAEWRKNAPTTIAPADSDTNPSVVLPALPEGADPFTQENYRIAAIRSYVTAKEHVLALMELAGEFDLGSETWASGMRDLATKFNEEAVHFTKLNPSSEYTEKHRTIIASMERISGYIEDLDQALVSGNFTEGSEALSLMQDEMNTMVQNGRFDEGSEFTPTTVPVP